MILTSGRRIKISNYEEYFEFIETGNERNCENYTKPLILARSERRKERQGGREGGRDEK